MGAFSTGVPVDWGLSQRYHYYYNETDTHTHTHTHTHRTECSIWTTKAVGSNQRELK